MGDIELTSAELDELERLAKAATPGIRTAGDSGYLYDATGHVIADFPLSSDHDLNLAEALNVPIILRLLSLARAGLEAGKAEESMRERAASTAEGYAEAERYVGPDANMRIATAIRALPLTGGKP